MREMIGLLKQNLKYHKYCIYSVEYTDEAKFVQGNHKEMLTAEQHSKMSQIDYKPHFESISKLLMWYFYDLPSLMKLDAIRVVGESVRGVYTEYFICGCGSICS